MSRTIYGKNPQKNIYIAPGSLDETTWKEIVDKAVSTRKGVGTMLMEVWRKRNNKE
jgi:hypothetical protein